MSLNPPRPARPPLNALRAFEAAARHRSFVKAADELSVTPGAIAQQVKLLENWTGDRLFDRHARGISLTNLGRTVSEDLTQVFDQLGQVGQKLRVNSSSHEIRIATLPSVAQFWIMPMLPEIRKLLPDTTVSVTAVEIPPNMHREPFDIAIFFEDKARVPESATLTHDEITPVCSPEYARKLTGSKGDFQPVLIHDSTFHKRGHERCLCPGISHITRKN